MRKAFLILIVFFISCNKSNKEIKSIDRKSEKKIIIEGVSDKPFDNVNELLKMDSYVILSPDVILADVKRVIYHNSNIYVFDSKDRIICYNKDGSIKYKIDAKGKGPGEYLRIMDFSIDEINNRINLYVGHSKIMTYSSKNGSYISTQTLDFITRNIANINGGHYFYNQSDIRNKDLSYNIMWSEDTDDINEKYFPIDSEVANYNFSLGNPFFYNNSELFFINQFDDIVYNLKSDGVIDTKFQIKLPNAASLSDVKRNPDLRKLLQSDYSLGITDIFQCENILSFFFSKKGHYNFAFYDLEKDKTIYCGQRISPMPTKELPVYYRISGVARNQFFSLVNPMAITYAVKRNPDVFPSGLLNVKESDNPVLMFYSIND